MMTRPKSDEDQRIENVVGVLLALALRREGQHFSPAQHRHLAQAYGAVDYPGTPYVTTEGIARVALLLAEKCGNSVTADHLKEFLK